MKTIKVDRCGSARPASYVPERRVCCPYWGEDNRCWSLLEDLTGHGLMNPRLIPRLDRRFPRWCPLLKGPIMVEKSD